MLDKLLTVEGDLTIDKVRGILGVSDLVLIQELLTIIARDSGQLPKFFENFRKYSLNPAVLTRDLLDYLRILMNGSLGYTTPHAWSGSEVVVFNQHLAIFNLNDLVFLSRLFLKAYKDFSFSESLELPLFLASCEATQRFVNELPATTTAPKILPPIIRESIIAVPIDENKIKQKWQQVIEAIKIQNGQLGTLVKNSPYAGVEDGAVWVEVKYLFHKEQLENIKSSQILSSALEQICGIKARILPKLVQVHQTSPAQVIQDALQVFGGELVE